MTIVSNSAINPFIFLLFNSTSQRASAITRWKDVLVEFTLDGCSFKTLPKALRTQALTALTSNFGLIGLVQYVW